jgi:hypothetical protein
MLTDVKPNKIGVTFEDATTIGDAYSLTALLSVTDETNQNSVNPQREVLLWHHKLGRAGFTSWIQKLARKPKDDVSAKSILEPKHLMMTSCVAPLCAACQLARQNRRHAPGEVRTADPNRDALLRQGDLLKPGDGVSLDQYMSALPGHLLKGYGKEKKKEKHRGGTLFVDHASSLMYLRHQAYLRASETIKAKRAFECSPLAKESQSRAIKLTTILLDPPNFEKMRMPNHKTYASVASALSIKME